MASIASPNEVEAPDRMLVAMFDVTGMSLAQIRSLEASMRHYAHDRFVSTNIYDGGPVSLRVCSWTSVADALDSYYASGAEWSNRREMGWHPVEESTL